MNVPILTVLIIVAISLCAVISSKYRQKDKVLFNALQPYRHRKYRKIMIRYVSNDEAKANAIPLVYK